MNYPFFFFFSSLEFNTPLIKVCIQEHGIPLGYLFVSPFFVSIIWKYISNTVIDFGLLYICRVFVMQPQSFIYNQITS